MAPYGCLHSEGLTDIKPIYRSDGIEVVFDEETKELTYYSFGKVEFKTDLPKNTEFCGVNKYHGTIYRAGNKVYLINHVDYKYEAKLLVTGVAEVIMAEYPYDHAFDSGITEYHPLFKMEDGTLKVYNMYTEELTPIEHEGGYVEVRPIY